MTEGNSILDRSTRAGTIADDHRLVVRCVSGEPGAWDALYSQCQEPLLSAIRALAGQKGSDAEFVDEIAARVWYFVVSNESRVLARFDPARNCRLTTFLAGIARNQLRMYLRSELRLHLRELNAANGSRRSEELPVGISNLELDELIDTLTEREREFLVWSTSPTEQADDRFAKTSAQWRYRLSRKIQAFQADNG